MNRYIILLLSLLTASCGGSRTEEDASSTAQDAGGASSDHELHLEADVSREWGIEVGSVAITDVSSIVILPGTVALNLNRTAYLSSIAPGKVAEISADLGDNVQKGEVLLTLNSPEFARSQTDYLEARARFNLSQKEYRRAISLFEEKAIEEREFLRREAEHEEFAARLGAAESALHSFGIEHSWIRSLEEKYERFWREGGDPDVIADPFLQIVSPVSGRVIFRDTVLGEQVAPGRIFFTVSDLKILWVELDAYEKDLPYVNRQSEVTIISPLYPDREFPGRITYIGDVMDENLRTVKVRIEVPDREKLLKPNMYIQGRIVNRDPGKELLAVPESAIVDIHGEKSVFVLEEAHEAGEVEEEDHLIYAVHHIQIGELVGDLRIVTGGLTGDELIVLKGAFTLKAELEKSSVGHDHVH